MVKQGNVLEKEKFGGAPIERAHLDRGFKAKKTPIKWIKFFRACVLQRENALNKKKKQLRILRVVAIIAAIICGFTVVLSFGIIFCIIGAFVGDYFINKKFNKKYGKGFDFFADYFSAFFTLIEEDLAPNSRITFDANIKETISPEFFVTSELNNGNEKGFRALFSSGILSRKNDFYVREICTGMFTFSDNAKISFQFTERIRERITKKRGQVSRKIKYKYKYKSAYPFLLQMKLPKDKYTLKPEIKTNDVNLSEDNSHYTLKVRRKFDPKAESLAENNNPNIKTYDPYDSEGITNFAVDYFALELINLINVCYSCVTPKQ